MHTTTKETKEILTYVHYDGKDLPCEEGMLAVLLSDAICFIGHDLTVLVNINSVFVGDLPAADAMVLNDTDQLTKLYEYYVKYGFHGVDIFAAEEKNMQPNKKEVAFLKEEFGIDLSYLPPNEYGQ